MKSSLTVEKVQWILNFPDFSEEDRAFFEYLAEFEEKSDPWVYLLAGMTMAVVREGSSCLDLSSPPMQFEELLERQQVSWPSEGDWERLFEISSIVGSEEDYAPLIFVKPNLLYLQRYYDHEKRLSSAVKRKCSQTSKSANEAIDSSTQDQAVNRALSQTFHIITGGPGTGKTTLALKFVVEWLKRQDDLSSVRLAAIAPTGKAAARLAESFSQGIESLETSRDVRDFVSRIDCSTIHRLLGISGSGSLPKFDSETPLDIDLVIADECSMIDLTLMRYLIEALPDQASILMLGDADQLSSVQVGTVLKDLVEVSKSSSSPLNGNVSQLSKTYRFSEDSPIFRICQSAKTGDLETFEALTKENSRNDVTLASLSQAEVQSDRALIELAKKEYRHVHDSKTPSEALSAIENFVVLTPTNEGLHGAGNLNREIIESRSSQTEQETLPARTPIMIRQNNYSLNLFNGDIGIIWHDEEGRAARAVFPSNDNGYRAIPLSLLPEFEPAYAITIHKSQGSEYNHVCVVLHPNETLILSRELIYTAFSRAKEKLSIFSNPEVMQDALQRKVRRASGLSQRLANEFSNSTH